MDLSQYAELFLAESREHLSACNQLLLAWERKPASLEPVAGLFRAVHTVKGMAATMGYGVVTDLAHRPGPAGTGGAARRGAAQGRARVAAPQAGAGLRRGARRQPAPRGLRGRGLRRAPELPARVPRAGRPDPRAAAGNGGRRERHAS